MSEAAWEPSKMLQIFWGDDEHTAAEGSYFRAVKTRKWIYFTAIVGLALDLGLYHEKAAAALLPVVSLPTYLLSNAAMVGLAYLLTQYSLILFQLVRTYDLVARERFTARRAEQLSKARSALRDAEREVDNAKTQFDSWEMTADPEPSAKGGAERMRLEQIIHNHTMSYEAAEYELKKLLEEDPSARPGYKLAETAIDTIRLSTPILVGTFSLYRLIL